LEGQAETMRYKRQAVRIALAAACLAAAWSGGLARKVNAQAVALTPYTAPDKTASAGIPPGWKVTKGAQTDIVMTGPHGESIFLGRTIVAQNGAFGRSASAGVDLSMPYSADLAQKLTMMFQAGATAAGAAAQQITITSATPIALPAALGQCGRFIGKSTGTKGAMTFATSMCSLPADSRGLYKNVFKLAEAPSSVAAQEGALAQAVFASYRVPAPMLERKLAPVTAPPVVRQGMAPPGAARAGVIAVPKDPTNSDCYDLVLIRETPTNELPRHCGGTAPD
jgi:hypothetical protein